MRPRSLLIQARHPRSMRKLRLHRMENQILGLNAGAWLFPLAFFIASLAWVHYKKNLTHYFGKIPLCTDAEFEKARKAGATKERWGKTVIEILKKDPKAYTARQNLRLGSHRRETGQKKAG